MGLSCDGIGVGDRAGGGINDALTVSTVNAFNVCVLGMAEMVDRRTVICFGNNGIVIFAGFGCGFGGFGTSVAVIVAIGMSIDDESSVSSSFKCVSKCSRCALSLENSFSQTLHARSFFLIGTEFADG